MTTLKEYFTNDFKSQFTLCQSLTLESPEHGIKIEVDVQVYLDFASGVKYIAVFIPQCNHPFDVCVNLLTKPNRALAESISEEVGIFSCNPGDNLDSSTLKYSGKFYIYCDNALSSEQVSLLNKIALEEGLSLQFRDHQYVQYRSENSRPLAFISHDFRDKKNLARPLAQELSKLACPVWYDEYSLKIGDNLRESIERGIKECKKCIVILTPHFLSNSGWTKVEFDSVFTKQIVEKKNVILPIWHRVSKQQVYEYCPSLANITALRWSIGREAIAWQINRTIVSD